MGKIKIKLNSDGTIEMETVGIKGKRCEDYAQILAKLADAKIDNLEKTKEYYEQENLQLDDVERLVDN